MPSIQLKPGERILPGRSHPWFMEHLDLWERLRDGDVIDVPDEIAELLKERIIVVGESKPAKTPKPSAPVMPAQVKTPAVGPEE